MKQKIVFDVDGVILSFSKGLSNYLWKTKRKYISLDPMTWDYNGKIMYEDLVEFWKSPGFEKLTPFDGIVEYIKELSFCKKYDIVFLTDIPNYAVAKRRTNLTNLGLDFPIYITSDKVGYIKEHKWDVAIMVDDKVETSLDCVVNNIVIASPVKEYNFDKLNDTPVFLYGDVEELKNIFRQRLNYVR